MKNSKNETKNEAPIIRFESVSKRYGETVILENFSLDIEKGDFLTIIGSSGSGKTTILKLTNGLLSPDEGIVRVRGKDIAKVDQIALRRNIGYAIQNVGLFPHLNVRENIGYVPTLMKTEKKDISRTVDRLVAMIGLDEKLLDRYPGELSGGQQQRVGIARALAASPEILLMDKPFGAVDEITRKMLQDEILGIHKRLGTTILFVTHDIKEALKLGNRVLVMANGKIQQIGTPDEIREKPATSFVASLTAE